MSTAIKRNYTSTRTGKIQYSIHQPIDNSKPWKVYIKIAFKLHEAKTIIVIA